MSIATDIKYMARALGVCDYLHEDVLYNDTLKKAVESNIIEFEVRHDMNFYRFKDGSVLSEQHL